MRGSRHILPLTILGVVITAATFASILFVDWMPAARSEQADRVDALLWFLVVSSALIMAGVTTVLVYMIFAFRAKKGDESDGPPNHGNTKLEIAWTILPCILLAVVGVWAYVVLTQNEELEPDRVEIEVEAAQFAWIFRYPEAGIQTGDLRVPDNTQVVLKMRSQDVIHDLYVPEWRLKKDVVPGITTDLIIDTKGVGTYPVICAELCGVGHGIMRSRAIVMERDDYDAWLREASRQVAADAQGGADTPTASAATP